MTEMKPRMVLQEKRPGNGLTNGYVNGLLNREQIPDCYCKA